MLVERGSIALAVVVVVVVGPLEEDN